ncbi:MAG: DUF1127 domain-containing protein [Hoeflea sp.]|uniref:DUF1127 domain-containing protein n=1 Tax=Hoeflea sp. TaxID=1940281 RepID=UPI0032EF2498
MLAETRPTETPLERSAVDFEYCGRTYLRFNALPENRPASNYPHINRMLAHACKPVEARPEPPEQSARPGNTLRLWVSRFLERRRMRREVGVFTEEMLRDLGMTRAQARDAARTPFWRDYR